MSSASSCIVPHKLSLGRMPGTRDASFEDDDPIDVYSLVSSPEDPRL